MIVSKALFLLGRRALFLLWRRALYLLRRLAFAVVLPSLIILVSPAFAHASDGLLQKPALLRDENDAANPRNGILIAQSDGDDAYDPFSDYSEFEESADEEEDINFFRNGRLLTIGFLGGYRGFTQTLGSIYSGSPAFGVFLSYFFDLRFALELGYVVSNHVYSIPATTTSLAINGSVNLSEVDVLTKYFFNTQNVTRGLADLNPYVIVGFSQVYRTETVTSNTNFAHDSAFAFDVGGGVEIPISRNKMYYGFQGLYQLTSFSDAGTVRKDENDQSTGVSPKGDIFTFLGILGVNF